MARHADHMQAAIETGIMMASRSSDDDVSGHQGVGSGNITRPKASASARLMGIDSGMEANQARTTMVRPSTCMMPKTRQSLAPNARSTPISRVRSSTPRLIVDASRAKAQELRKLAR
jgi:hypothetical protein